MRYLVISDIHANLQALDAVMTAAGELSWERVVVLGDLVGYGADPNAVIDRVRALAPHAIIRGNHDKVGAGIAQADGFNGVARHAIHWTLDTLTPDNRTWLAALPAGPTVVDDAFEICHGTPYDEDAYVFDDLDALRALHAARRAVCLFGHTHMQAGYGLVRNRLTQVTSDMARPLDIRLDEATRYLINPGSIGQPRDNDPRAGFALLDTGTRCLTIHRIDYPIADAQARIVAAGLPAILATRLASGR